MILVSVVMPFYNDVAYLRQAIHAILAQTFKKFEFILIDDNSAPDASLIAKSFNDPRIRYVRNARNLGITKSRNRGIRMARGTYTFITDSDCIADPRWIEEGLKSFKGANIVGVEGKTYYISPHYKPTLADRLPGTISARGQYMMCNIAYRTNAIKRLGYLNESLAYHEDREFALRAMSVGTIVFQPRMRITHQRKLWSIRGFLTAPQRARNRILFFKRFNERQFMKGRVLFPLNYLKMILPPLVVARPLLDGRIRTWQDVKLVPFLWIRLFYERYIIWKTAIQERVFVI